MPILKVEGVPPLDGVYDLDVSSFNGTELHIIKQETETAKRPGVRAGELLDALAAGDNDLLLAFALIVLRRAGKGEPAVLRGVVWEAPPGAVTVDFSEAEKAAMEAEEVGSPPVSEPEENSAPVTSTDPSGSDSPEELDAPANGQSHTGLPTSLIGSTFDRAT